MESDQLRTFLAVHRAGGFTSAARVLHLSQPAISRRLTLLEAEIGAPLFERTRGGTSLSPAGRVLLPHAERTLAALEDCVASIRALRTGVAGPVSIAVVGTLASTELTPILKKFASRHPDVELTLRTASSAEVSDLVRRGEVTLGIRYLRDSSPDVRCEPLRPERLVVACGRRHRFADQRIPEFRQLATEQWLAFPRSREATAETLFAHFLTRGVASIRWTPIDSLTAQKRLVEAGFGLALVPESSIREELAGKSLAQIEVADLDATNPVFALVRKAGYLSPAARDLLQVLAASLPHRARGRRRGVRSDTRLRE